MDPGRTQPKHLVKAGKDRKDRIGILVDAGVFSGALFFFFFAHD